MRQFLKYSFLSLFLILAIVLISLFYFVRNWQDQPIEMAQEEIQLVIQPNMHMPQITQALLDQGVHLEPAALFIQYAQWKGFDRQIKAGAYKIQKGDTPNTLLDKLIHGKFTYKRVTFIEGYTLNDFIHQIQKIETLKQDIPQENTIEFIKNALDINTPYLEGWFYPDTYSYIQGDSSLSILKQSYHYMVEVLNDEWQNREANLPYKTPYEALIMASIIEKETAKEEDRKRVAGVFINRLRKGMLLQTDPTVIYGMGEEYKGNIRKRDLQKDTPWNTYTRVGLPISPICSPSKASIQAALHPEHHDYYYFSAKGLGQTETLFSKTLREHQRNVRKYLIPSKK